MDRTPTAIRTSLSCRNPTPLYSRARTANSSVSREQGKGQPARRNGREHLHHRFSGDAAPHAEKPQVERDDRPDQQGDPEDVRGVDAGIEPAGTAQSLRQGGPLDRREQGLQGLSRARGKGRTLACPGTTVPP